MTSKEALNDLKESAQKFCEWELIRLNIIEKDLEILEILKKSMSVETEYFDDDGTSKEYEFITFYDMELWENNEKEYNKIKEWLKEK